MRTGRGIPPRRTGGAHLDAPAIFAVLLACGIAVANSPAGAGTGIPVVHGFTPSEGGPGTIVKIAGEEFDQVLWVEFPGGLTADFRLFTSQMLKVEVPDGAASGPILLRTATGGAWTPSDFHVIETPAGALALAPPSPSPGAPPYRLGFHLPAARRIHLDVYDLSGRRVRSIADGAYGRGPHLATWDGRDAEGHRASPGLYLVALRIEKGIITRRLIVVE